MIVIKMVLRGAELIGVLLIYQEGLTNRKKRTPLLRWRGGEERQRETMEGGRASELMVITSF